MNAARPVGRAAAGYGYRCSEEAVLSLLAAGIAAEEIAARQAVRLSTVRTHIRHLLEKTGTRRILDLVQMLAG